MTTQEAFVYVSAIVAVTTVVHVMLDYGYKLLKKE